MNRQQLAIEEARILAGGSGWDSAKQIAAYDALRVPVDPSEIDNAPFGGMRWPVMRWSEWKRKQKQEQRKNGQHRRGGQ
jgi:hypothetical protein